MAVQHCYSSVGFLGSKAILTQRAGQLPRNAVTGGSTAEDDDPVVG
jgi:hypothetical protein